MRSARGGSHPQQAPSLMRVRVSMSSTNSTLAAERKSTTITANASTSFTAVHVGSALTQSDIDLHARLGIDASTLETAKISRVTDRQAREDCGLAWRGDLSGIVYPRISPWSGRVVGFRVRRDRPDIRDGKTDAKYLSSPDRAHLYFAPGTTPALLSDTGVPIVVVEGEKSVLALTAAGRRAGRALVVVGLGGCWGWRGRIGKVTAPDGAVVDEKGPLPDWNRLEWKNREAVIVFDANAGSNPKVEAARHSLAEYLRSLGAQVRIAELPLESGVNGPDDFVAKHGDAALFERLDAAEVVEQRGGKSQATILLRLAREAGVICFRDDDVPYLRVPIEGHDEIMPLRSRATRAWLQGLYVDATSMCAGGQAIKDASSALEAYAVRGANERVHVRIAATADAIYFDLGDSSWRVVEVRASGWNVVSSAPVRFRRPKGLLPLPAPTPGSSITALRPFLNIDDGVDGEACGEGFVLLVLTLAAMLRGRGPYPVLVIDGEQGSAKSTLCRIIKALIDPNAAPLRSEPREPRDLMITAAHSHVLAFDNLSGIPAWLSDCFCRLSTGGGFSTRTLYEDAEEQIFDAIRPLVVNGIVELATRPDLASRAVMLSLPRIASHGYRDERRFWTHFEAARPQILGALLDLVAAGLSREGSIRLDGTPRMADFALWSTAVEAACPWPAGTFMRIYSGNREGAARAALEGHPLVDLVRHLAAPRWSGLATELLKVLNERTSEAVRKQRDWKFKMPRDLTNELKRIAPELRILGYDYIRPPLTGRKRDRIIELEQLGQPASAASASSATSDSSGTVDEAGGPSADDRATPSSAPSSAATADSAPACPPADDADDADAVELPSSDLDDEGSDGRF